MFPYTKHLIHQIINTILPSKSEFMAWTFAVLRMHIVAVKHIVALNRYYNTKIVRIQMFNEISCCLGKAQVELENLTFFFDIDCSCNCCLLLYHWAFSEISVGGNSVNCSDRISVHLPWMPLYILIHSTGSPPAHSIYVTLWLTFWNSICRRLASQL